MIKKRVRDSKRYRRRRRIRHKIQGSPERPRLTVFRSNKNIYAQLIDDRNGETLLAASTLDDELGQRLESTPTVTLEVQGTPTEFGGKRRAAVEVGRLLAERAREKGIDNVVFDRNGYIYHGRVAAVAAGARDGGLNF